MAAEKEKEKDSVLSSHSRLIAFKFPPNSPWNHSTIFIYFFVCDFMVSYISFQHKPSSGIIFLYQIRLHIIPTFSFIFMEVTLPCFIMCLQEVHFIFCSCLGFLLFFVHLSISKIDCLQLGHYPIGSSLFAHWMTVDYRQWNAVQLLHVFMKIFGLRGILKSHLVKCVKRFLDWELDLALNGT